MCTCENWHKCGKEPTVWNPPDVSLSTINTEYRDLNGAPMKKASIYKFPWYLCYMPLYYGLKHWWRTREWPERVLYFSEAQQLDKRIFLDVIRHPQDFYSAGPKYTWDLPITEEGEDFDELVKRLGIQDEVSGN